MATTLNAELERIAGEVRAIVEDPELRPAFAPDELLEAVLAYPSAGGKALRPALLALSCRALGGEEAAALRAGAAVELYHTYTLVHDDVIDRDEVRRGRPSVHARMAEHARRRLASGERAARYGISMAILAGDCLQCWAIDLLASLPDLGSSPAVVLQLVRRLEGVSGPAIVEGEALDVLLPFLPVEEVSREMILRVIRTKTAALFAYCAWAGGMLARGTEDAQVRALAEYAERAGIAFQLQDDVLGLIGEETELGKPVGSDLREGKRTIIIALGWERADARERALLMDALGNEAASQAAVAAATDLLRRLGALDDAQAMAGGYLASALRQLQRLPESDERQMLAALAERMVKREK